MSVGFGFSIGDFLAALNLVQTVIDALQSSGQASSAYRELVRELYTLEHTLSRVKELEFHKSQSTDRIALVQAASQCQLTIDDFWKGIQKYQPHLRTEGSGSRIKDVWMEIKWALCKVDDLAAFRAALQGHSSSIQILLLTVEMKRSSIQEQRQDQQQNSLTGLIQDMSFQWMTKLSVIASTVVDCLQQSKQLLQSTAEIMRTNIHIFQAVLDLQRFITGFPGQIQRDKPVLLWDAKGRFAPFHLEFIDCPEALLAVLKVRFKYSGLRKIENGQFALFDPNTKRDVDLAQPWSRCFRPGQTVHMSMIFELSTCQDSTCPACHVVNSADDSSEIECIKCGIHYQRITGYGEDSYSSEPERTEEDSAIEELREYCGTLRPKRPDLDPILSQDEEVLEYSRIRFATIKSPPAIDSKDIPNFGVLPGAPNLPEEYDSNVPRFLHFYSQLLLFKEDLHREIFKFPPTLSPAERRIVHTVAHKMKLGHVSKGKGDQRAVHVFRERPDRLSNALEPPPPGKRIQSLR